MTANGHRHNQRSDAELLRRVGMQDAEAFRQLYMEYFGRLGRFLTRVTTKPQLIEEIINDTMFVVWKRAADFRGDSRPSTWVFGIAYRVALKAVARERRPALSPVDPEHVEAGIHEAQVDELLGRAELDDWLRTALGCLSAEHRLAVELAYFMGMSCDEIAEVMDCPAGTVKTRIFHARRHLKGILQKLAAPAGDRARAPGGPR